MIYLFLLDGPLLDPPGGVKPEILALVVLLPVVRARGGGVGGGRPVVRGGGGGARPLVRLSRLLARAAHEARHDRGRAGRTAAGLLHRAALHRRRRHFGSNYFFFWFFYCMIFKRGSIYTNVGS